MTTKDLTGDDPISVVDRFYQNAPSKILLSNSAQITSTAATKQNMKDKINLQMQKMIDLGQNVLNPSTNLTREQIKQEFGTPVRQKPAPQILNDYQVVQSDYVINTRRSAGSIDRSQESYHDNTSSLNQLLTNSQMRQINRSESQAKYDKVINHSTTDLTKGQQVLPDSGITTPRQDIAQIAYSRHDRGQRAAANRTP